MDNWEDLEKELQCNRKRISTVEFVALFKKYDADGKNKNNIGKIEIFQ